MEKPELDFTMEDVLAALEPDGAEIYEGDGAHTFEQILLTSPYGRIEVQRQIDQAVRAGRLIEVQIRNFDRRGHKRGLCKAWVVKELYEPEKS